METGPRFYEKHVGSQCVKYFFDDEYHVQQGRSSRPWYMPKDPSSFGYYEVPVISVNPKPEDFDLSEHEILAIQARFKEFYDLPWWKRIFSKPNTGYPKLENLCKFEEAKSFYDYWKERFNRDFWWDLTGIEFEHEVARVFRANGHEAKVTIATGDEGIDIVLKLNGKTTGVQCKHYAKAVGQPALREFWGSLLHFGAEQGVFIASSGYTKPAWNFADGKPLLLLDLEDILELAENGGNIISDSKH